MAAGQLGTVIQHIRKLVASQAAQELTDGQLLERFSLQRDEMAFSALLARHGGLVWNVCRHVLANDHDAEDAFQATFLVLARKAPSINKVGSWLHKVAFLSAMEMKRKAARRRVHETQAARMAPPHPTLSPEGRGDIAWRELLAVLDEEVQRLPEKYREPFVLCCLEAKSKTEAAKQLGWKEGTVSGRLAQARRRLQQRLARRGITLSAALTAAALSNNASSATVPTALVDGTVRQVFLFIAGRAIEMVGSPAAALAEAVMKSMMVSKLKAGMAVALIATFLAGGIGLATYRALPATGEPSEAQDRTPIPHPHPPPQGGRGKEGGREKEGADGPDSKGAKQARTDLYGDPLPQGAISRLGTTRLRHFAVSWLQFTPDGKSLISEGADGVRIWKVSTGEQLQFFPHETGQMAFEGSSLATDGNLLAIAGKSDVGLFEPATAKRIKSIKTGTVTCARLSPDGKILAVQQEKAPYPFELWDTTTGRLLRSGGGDPSFFACLGFADNGKTLITAGSRFQTVPPSPHYYIRFWDVATAREMRHFDLGPANPRKIVPSPDGKFLAVICQGDRGTENRIHLWDLAAGKEIRQLVPTAKGFTEQTNYSTGLAFSPDGKTLYAGALEGKLFAWNPATGEELRRIGTDFLSPRALAVSPDNKTLAADVVGDAIRLVDATTGEDRIPDSGHQHWILRTAVTPDGRTVVTGDAFHTFLWGATTGRQLRRIEGDGIWFADLQLINGGRSLLTVERDKARQIQTLRVQELDTGKELRRIEWRGKEREQQGYLVAPDGKVLTTSQFGDIVVVKDSETGREVGKYSALPQEVYLQGQAFLPDGHTLVMWGSDHVIRLCDLAAGRESKPFTFSDTWGEMPMPVGASDPPYTAEVSRAGRLMACVSPHNRFIELRELPTGTLVRKLESLPDRPNHIAFSPDEKTLAWGGDRAPMVHLVELATGGERQHFTGHKGGIYALAFSADGRTLVSGSADTTAMVWDLTGRHGEKGLQGKPLGLAELDSCWSDLAGGDAARAYQAICRVAASPNEAIPYLRKQLKAVPAVDKDRLAQLIADLDSNQFAARESAAMELEKLGELAGPACRKALEQKPSAEMRRRLEALLEKQTHEVWNPSADRLRMLRAIEALEHMATPEAKQVLASLAKGAPEARLTQEAKASLERLAKRADQGP